MKIWRKRLTDRLNDEVVYRTAPATPGLLNTYIQKTSKNVWNTQMITLVPVRNKMDFKTTPSINFINMSSGLPVLIVINYHSGTSRLILWSLLPPHWIFKNLSSSFSDIAGVSPDKQLGIWKITSNCGTQQHNICIPTMFRYLRWKCFSLSMGRNIW